MHDDERLRDLVRQTPWLLRLLETVRDTGPAGAYVAAGTIRNAVWDMLHGRAVDPPTSDVDVIYFDLAFGEVDWVTRLSAASPRFTWDVANQAQVHEWQSVHYGRAIRPYASVAAALERWPETATAVAARLDAEGAIEVLAPFGLEDLFELRLRPSPKVLTPRAFQERVREKGWLSRWPELCVVEPSSLAVEGPRG